MRETKEKRVTEVTKLRIRIEVVGGVETVNIAWVEICRPSDIIDVRMK